MSEEAAYRMKLRDIVNRLQRDPQIDGNTCDAAKAWMNNQFAEMEQEKAQPIVQLKEQKPEEREQEQEIQTAAVEGRPSLRDRLKYLVMSIIQQFGHDVKGVERNA